MSVRIRPARTEDAERLREIAIASKGHWGYDPEQVRQWGAMIDFPSETYVAESGDTAIGWMALDPKADLIWLADMWVDPPWIGKGVGALLFRRAVERARDLGATTMEWEAEPNAVGFYEKVGGRYLRDSEPSEWGRTLPVMGVEVAG